MIIGTHKRLNTISGSAGALDPITHDGEVPVFADLPPAADHTGEEYVVETTTNRLNPFTTTNWAGLYRSNGTDWLFMGVDIPAIQELIDSAAANIITGVALQPGNILTFTKTDATTFTINLDDLEESPELITSIAFDDVAKELTFTKGDASTFVVDIAHTHVKADITDFDDADYATAAQGALADTALQSETAETLQVVGSDLVFTGSDGTPQSIPLSTFGEDDTSVVSAAMNGNTLELTKDDAAGTIVPVNLSQFDDSAAIAALAAGAVAMNTATLLTKADVNHTHVEADITDLDKYTQAEVDALLANKSDVGHTHVEADITDLDKYSQAEVDTLIEDMVTVNLATLSLYVAPDAGSAQPGDFIGGVGIRDAIREANKTMIQNPTSFINIYLRDGEYTLVSPIEISHPQGKKVIRLRPLTLQSLATNQLIDLALTTDMSDKAADDAVLAANYNVIINCPSYAMFFDKGTGIETVDSIMFRYTGTNTSRAGVYCAQQGSATLARCAFIGFPYAVRALEFASVGITTGGFFIYCNLSCLRAEEMSVIRVTQSANYRTTFHSITQYTVYALTKAYIRVVAASTSRIKAFNDSTNRANFLLTGMATMACTRVDAVGGDEGWSVQQGSFCQISSCTIRGNASYAVFVSSADATVTSLDADPLGTTIQQRVYALRGSNINETGTHPNVNFVPTIGSVADSSAID